MYKDILDKSTPTAQVRILAEKLLSDGKVHSRREIIEYVRKKGSEYGLKSFRPGCISGGIQQAVANCDKLEAATYQLKSENASEKLSQEMKNHQKSIEERVSEICSEFISQVTKLSRTIDYVNAGDDEMEQLDDMRECIKYVKKLEQKYKK